MAGRGSYRSRKKRSLSRVYWLVALVLVLVTFKWGFAFLIEIIGKTGGNGTRTNITGDVVPPQTPVISALPEATNSATLKVEGYTESKSEVEYFVNGRRVITEQADESGFYKANLNLEEGDNLLKVRAKDEAGNESTSKPINVIYDFKSPVVDVDSPTEGQEFFGRQAQTVSINGSVSEPNSDLRINNTYIRLDHEGLFAHQVKLDEGENEIKFVATDIAGNVTAKTIKVTYVR